MQVLYCVHYNIPGDTWSNRILYGMMCSNVNRLYSHQFADTGWLCTVLQRASMCMIRWRAVRHNRRRIPCVDWPANASASRTTRPALTRRCQEIVDALL